MILGAALGTQGNQGRNKITLITSPEIWDMSAWLEQLLAESTGKKGKGLIPISDEKVGPPHVYEDDRVFVYLKMAGSFDRSIDAQIQTLAEQNHPIIQIDIQNSYSLGEEFYRWEIATAVAGSILGINPFDQPDVESSKEETRKLMKQFETQGSLPLEEPFYEENGIQLYANGINRSELEKSISNSKSLKSYFRAHLNRITSCDYFAILAYLNMNFDDEEILRNFRHQLRDSKRVATCLEFGPRYLHSTGQVYKGGPNLGVFLQITADPEKDLPVPAHPYQFGVVKMAQALGDFEVLQQRKRRCLRVHLGSNKSQGLRTVYDALIAALKSEKSK
jgi:transaldolase/glucose-6-phosphate isomerase